MAFVAVRQRPLRSDVRPQMRTAVMAALTVTVADSRFAEGLSPRAERPETGGPCAL
jgi:hypothetical protein